MANTTNYNWETPDDTDLVKDGAAAIRTLGSSVDTTTKALNPSTTLGDIEYRSSTANTNTRLGIGTTGQVLTVAGGVPTWATSDDANAIQNAIVDAKGDLIAASAADTPARLAVGANGTVLTADSAETTGLKWATPAGGSRGLNQIIPTSVAVGSGTATVGTNGMITCTTVGTNLSINGCFTSTYTNYLIVMDTDFSSSYDFPSIRMRASGSDNSTASSYIYQRQTVSDTTVAGSRLTANRWQDAFAIDDSKTNGIELTFYRPFEADSTAIATANEVFALSGAYIWRGCGTHNQNTSYDGFSIILGSGTITGKLRVYGWQE